eukprot:gene9200-11688_t
MALPSSAPTAKRKSSASCSKPTRVRSRTRASPSSGAKSCRPAVPWKH